MQKVFICGYIRSPIGRHGGALAPVRADDLAAHSIKSLMERNSQIDWAELDEVALGCANQAGEDNRNVARLAVLLAGLPETVPALTVNRLCASGMDAVIHAARAIGCGDADLMIAGGVESMSRAPLVMPKAETGYSRRAEVFDTTIGWRFVNPLIKAQYGIDSMPETAENVAEEFQILRVDQDAFALESQRRAAIAQSSGRLAKEIAPIAIKTRKGSITVEHDEHPRSTSAQKLAGLKTPFRKNGTVTAGNASGVNDGSAAILLASEAAVSRHSLVPMAEYTGAASAGVAPPLMGIGPVAATQKLCKKIGQQPQDFDLIELNEAFASQAVAVLHQFGLDPASRHINPNGGAIALGHPLGMSGARLVGTAALELQLGGAQSALCSLCVGVGQGVSLAMRAVR